MFGSFPQIVFATKPYYVYVHFMMFVAATAIAHAGAPVDIGTWGRVHSSTPCFGSHLNPIPTRWGRLFPPYTNVPTKF